jgi:hypothetical protein
MSNSNNVAGQISPLYKSLIDEYDKYKGVDKKTIEGKQMYKKRFMACYQIADNATYIDICFALQVIYELEIPEIGINKIDKIIKFLQNLVASTVTSRCLYIQRILEEAKERKRQ